MHNVKNVACQIPKLSLYKIPVLASRKVVLYRTSTFYYISVRKIALYRTSPFYFIAVRKVTPYRTSFFKIYCRP